MASRYNSWENVYHDWKQGLARFYTPLDSLVSFQSIKVDEPKDSRTVRWGIDWWPAAHVNERIESLRTFNGVWGLTSKGTMHTAELLFEYRNNIEMASAVLIAAAIHRGSRESREDWHNPDLHVVVHEMEAIIRHTFPQIEWWHHASSDALPIDLPWFIIPKYDSDIMDMFALRVTLCLKNWQLVNVYSPKGLDNFIREQQWRSQRSG